MCWTLEVKPRKGEWPVMKSRASMRIPSTLKGVRKSTPPPTCNAPVLLLEEEELKCARPPPKLANGDMLLRGRNFTCAAGVKKTDEKSPLKMMPPGPVREGEPAKGSSTYSAAARKFARRYARDACQEMPGPIETEPMVPCGIGQMMASPQVTGPLPSGDTAAPRVNETSVFCAWAATPASSRNTKRAQRLRYIDISFQCR